MAQYTDGGARLLGGVLDNSSFPVTLLSGKYTLMTRQINLFVGGYFNIRRKGEEEL